MCYHRYGENSECVHIYKEYGRVLNLNGVLRFSRFREHRGQRMGCSNFILQIEYTRNKLIAIVLFTPSINPYHVDGINTCNIVRNTKYNMSLFMYITQKISATLWLFLELSYPQAMQRIVLPQVMDYSSKDVNFMKKEVSKEF